MHSIFRKINNYGMLGVFAYIVLCAPFIRGFIFGGGAKILDVYGGEVSSGDGSVFSFFTQYTLYAPYLLNEYVFRWFDVYDVNVLVVASCIPMVYRYFSFSTNNFVFVLLLFLFLPVPLVTLSTFNKDYILVMCVFFSYGYSNSGVTRDNWILFFVYAFFLRAYLMIVPYFIRFGRSLWSGVGAGLGFILVLGTEEGRDVVYRLFNRRMFDKGYIANSEINQTVYVENLLDVFLVLAEVLPQIFMPVLYMGGVKGVFFQAYMWVLLLMVVYFRSAYSNTLLVLLLLYVIIDPDLGAFIRHISAFFLLFPLVLGLRFGVEENRKY